MAGQTEVSGANLRRRRSAAGYSREEFARLVGISPRTLEAWEGPHGHVPPGKVALVEEILSRATQGRHEDSAVRIAEALERIAVALEGRA